MKHSEGGRAYPLSWPFGFPRATCKVGDQFRTTLAGALYNVETSLGLFGKDSGKKVENVCISSNCTLGVQRPTDSGVSVWFSWDGLQVCIPVDRYEKVEANLQAIHHIIEARRTELRHGGLNIVRAAFTGLAALPAPGQTSFKGWREVLGVGAEVARLTEVDKAYRTLRSRYHPDKEKGDPALFHAVQIAWEQAQAELGNPA